MHACRALLVYPLKARTIASIRPDTVLGPIASSPVTGQVDGHPSVELYTSAPIFVLWVLQRVQAQHGFSSRPASILSEYVVLGRFFDQLKCGFESPSRQGVFLLLRDC